MPVYYDSEAFITVDWRSRMPIYEQIIYKIKELVISGTLITDQPIPSIRELTRQLGINPNTIQKAYAELEREGVIYTVPGRGAYIAEDLNRIKNAKYVQILTDLEILLNEAKKHSVKRELIEDVLNIVYHNNNKKELI